MKIAMFEAFCDEMANLSSSDFLDNLFKIAAYGGASWGRGVNWDDIRKQQAEAARHYSQKMKEIGFMRVGGTVGAGLGSIGASYVTDHLRKNDKKNNKKRTGSTVARDVALEWGLPVAGALGGVGLGYLGARMGKIASSLGVSATNTLMKISMFEAFCDEMTKLSSVDLLGVLLKIAALPPPTLAPGGMMHAESMLAGLAKKTLPRTGRIAGEHNAIVNMARRAGHAGEGGSSIKSLIPGSSKPSMPPASHGFSIPPLSSSAPGATLPPQATIPAPRAA